MVGDRLDTDIAFGHSGQLSTLLVLTGVTAKQDLLRPPPPRRPPHAHASSMKGRRIVQQQTTSTHRSSRRRTDDSSRLAASSSSSVSVARQDSEEEEEEEDKASVRKRSLPPEQLPDFVLDSVADLFADAPPAASSPSSSSTRDHDRHRLVQPRPPASRL